MQLSTTHTPDHLHTHKHTAMHSYTPVCFIRTFHIYNYIILNDSHSSCADKSLTTIGLLLFKKGDKRLL